MGLSGRIEAKRRQRSRFGIRCRLEGRIIKTPSQGMIPSSITAPSLLTYTLQRPTCPCDDLNSHQSIYRAPEQSLEISTTRPQTDSYHHSSRLALIFQDSPVF
jgi:hypothetical protein